MDKDELFAREERCQKAIQSVRKAVIARLLVTALLLWIIFGTGLELWVAALIAVVLIGHLAGLLPLIQEWKKQKKLLDELIDMEED